MAWPNGHTINPTDATPQSPSSCVFRNELYLFWKANDSSNRIYFSPSPGGTGWPAGRIINDTDSTPQTPVSCVFKDELYVFWKANDSSNRIYFSASPNGTAWPAGRIINDTDSTPDVVAAVVFENKLYLFWKANDSSNRIYFSASANGTTWPCRATYQRERFNAGGLERPRVREQAVSLLEGERFNWLGNRIYFSASPNGTGCPAGRVINDMDSTPQSPASCVFNKELYVFWKANDSSNRICASARLPAARGGPPGVS